MSRFSVVAGMSAGSGPVGTDRAAPRLRLLPAPPSVPDDAFTSHDLMALNHWMQRADGHGYRRLLIERGSGDTQPEGGSYVLVYAPGSEWARWGLARTSAGVMVWHCSDGADLGHFATMTQALDRLPPVWTRRLNLRSKPNQRIWRCTLACPG